MLLASLLLSFTLGGTPPHPTQCAFEMDYTMNFCGCTPPVLSPLGRRITMHCQWPPTEQMLACFVAMDAMTERCGCARCGFLRRARGIRCRQCAPRATAH